MRRSACSAVFVDFEKKSKMQLTQYQALEMLTARHVLSDIDSPIDFIFVEHLKHRILCWILDKVAAEEYIANETMDAVISFLEIDYILHIADEEQDLFPALLRRAKPEDDLEERIAELVQEHATDKKDAVRVGECLQHIIANRGGPGPSRAMCSLLRRFSANERQHLIVENGIVLPLARVRLQRDDLAQISAGMAMRRIHIHKRTSETPDS